MTFSYVTPLVEQMVTLNLSDKEAKILLAVMGGIGGSDESGLSISKVLADYTADQARKVTNDIYYTLKEGLGR